MKISLHHLIFSSIVTFLSICTLAQNKIVSDTQNNYSNSNFTYVIINASHQTFGYDIYVDSRLMIHQTSITGVPGNNGFKTKRAAEKVAKFVISKIKKGVMPPTVSIEELRKLKVL